MNIDKIWFEDKKIFLKTDDGKKASMPLEWFPRLEKATVDQRNDYNISPFGIHWRELDEDLSFEGFFKFKKDNSKV